jgi:hypothetical protein
MWKWIVGAVVLVVATVAGLGFYLSDKIYLRPVHATVTADDMARAFTPDELQADFTALLATVDRIHPNPAALHGPRYDTRVASIRAKLEHAMTREEFFRIAGEINSAWLDGHTSLRRPKEEWDAFAGAGKVIPFTVRLDDTGVYVGASLDPQLPPGVQLITLNRMDVNDVGAWASFVTSGETIPYRRAYAEERFANLVFAYGLRAPFALRYRDIAGMEHDVQLAGVPFPQWQAATGGASAPYSVHVDGKTAILVINTLESPSAAYGDFLKSAFTKIRDAGATSLILDLRHNGGGDSRQGDLLLSYLSDQTLPAITEVAVHTTPEVKALYRTLLPEGFRWLPLNAVIPMLAGIQNGPDNGFYRFKPEGPAPKPRSQKNPLAFSGDLYVLISPVTYSSAAILAAPLKHWKRATLIGEASGEPLEFFGDNYEFDLPNTKLIASVSHKSFRLVGDGDPRQGVQPDIPTTPDERDATKLALKAIAEKH